MSAGPSCSLAGALTSAQGGENLSLVAGSYDLSAVPLPPVPLPWMSTDRRARPALNSSAAAPTLSLTPAQSGSSIDGLAFDNTNTASANPEPALLLVSGVDADVRASVVSQRRPSAPGTTSGSRELPG